MSPIAQGALVDLTIERPVAGGRMLARHGGAIVLVDGAIPGETVRARIERVGRVALATVVDVVEASPSRVSPALDRACGGMIYAHIKPGDQPALKQAILVDALRHGARLDWTTPFTIHSSPARGYRMRARLHVRNGRVGFFREGTHDICRAGDTGQLGDESVRAVERFVSALPLPAIEALDAIDLAENLAADQRVLHLAWHERARVARAMLANIELSEGLDGVSVGGRQASLPMVVAGTPFVADALESLVGVGASAPAGAVIRRHASAFFQANRFLLRRLVDAVAAQVPEGPVVDLYAGVGLFALTLASEGHDAVTAVEADRVSGADLSVNAGPFGGRVAVSRQAVEEWLAHAAIERGTTVIVDPPRTGMSRDALEALLAARASRVVYVSCDVATLARDVRRAIDAGYRVSHLEAFDLFPNTAHVETLAVLVR